MSIVPAETNPFYELMETLPKLHEFHSPTSAVYAMLKRFARQAAVSRFGPESPETQDFPPFGLLTFPYFSMGALSSMDLFYMDELIIFSFYWANRNRYRKVADIGANIGLHSVLLNRCGYEVRSFEPDPIHFSRLRSNLKANDCHNVTVVEAAVSGDAGEQEFVRVLGNTTGSHLAGSKPNPYGDLERFKVKVVPVGPILEWADLVKLDVEGHEKTVILATTREHWATTDALVEVGSERNAVAVYDHLCALGVRMFAQKISWGQVSDPSEMPTSYHDGTLFVTMRDAVPWG